MDKTNVMVEFEIYGDKFDPNTITEMLGITPTETRIKGEPGRFKHAINKYTTWQFDTGYKESYDINDQLKEIYDIFKGKIHILNNIRKEYAIEFGICIVINIENDEKPAMGLEHWVIDFLHEIHAEVGFDIYDYS